MGYSVNTLAVVYFIFNAKKVHLLRLVLPLGRRIETVHVDIG